MKLFRLPLLFATGLFSFCNLQAQSEENPWQFYFGINSVDTFPTGASGSGALFEEFLNIDHWNITPFPSFVGIKNYIGAGFSLGTRFSFNKIKHYGTLTGDDNYYNADATVTYYLGQVMGFQRLLPILEIGGGYAIFGETGAGYFNLGAGLEYWFGEKKKTGIVLESIYKNTGERYGTKHFQHLLGVAFLFGADPDRDGDGIIDKEDACPDIPGTQALQGCPDQDGDGITDAQDDCPTVFGIAALKGCPDRDGDGIPDAQDTCPDTAGLPIFNGCPDTDKDGIQDAEDDCPNVGGSIALKGCPDRDGDEIKDEDDNCPEVAGSPENSGCPDAIEEVVIQLDEIGQRIYFEVDSSEITPQCSIIIDEVVTLLKINSGYFVEVHGHTDSTGYVEYNQTLSERRASAVKEHLISKGISRDRIQTLGFGETRPVQSNATAEGRKFNRRTEFKLK